MAAAALLISGCASRYILSEREIEDARRRSAVPELGVYVSHRTVPVYERSEMHAKRIGREIDERSRRGRLRRPIGKNDMGLIVDEDLRNGARRLWVSFSLECRDRACSYGFVRGEDGRFHLVSLPERADYDVSKVFRSVVMGRHEMTVAYVPVRMRMPSSGSSGGGRDA